MQIDLPIKNFPAQQSIFDHPAKFKMAVKGRRFGLTKGAANDFILQALQGKFKRGLWVDVVNSNIDRYIDRYFMPILKKLPSNLYLRKKQDKIIYIKDAYIDFRSSDRPESLEGFGYDKAFLNEAGIILKDEYLWNNAIRPMLWEYKPQTVIGGTPKGKGLFYELFLRGLDPEQKDYKSFHFTSFDNPYLDSKLLSEEIKSMPENNVRQEIYAKFLDDVGVVFRGVKEVAISKPRKPESGHMYVMGVDLAKYEDFTVIVVYDRKDNTQVYQERFNQIDWNLQKKKIISICKTYNNALTIIDATGLGDPIADDLIRSGIPVEPYKLTNTSKKELIEKLIIWIEQKKLKMLALKQTVDEFNAFAYDISRTGKIRYNAPVGFHDDIVIAHGLALSSLQPITKTISGKEPTLVQRELNRQIRQKERDYGDNIYF